jgi:hypothetical protein
MGSKPDFGFYLGVMWIVDRNYGKKNNGSITLSDLQQATQNTKKFRGESLNFLNHLKANFNYYDTVGNTVKINGSIAVADLITMKAQRIPKANRVTY